jgi:hypothetical protein
MVLSRLHMNCIPLSRFTAALILLAVIGFVAGCRTSTDPERLPGGSDLYSAAAFLGGLKEQGKLPGVAKSDHGTLQSAPVEVAEASKQNGLRTVTMKMAIRNKEDLLFWYQVHRPNSGGPWMLSSAWRTDSAGQQRVQIWLDNGL